jgi:hypothetical protein
LFAVVETRLLYAVEGHGYRRPIRETGPAASIRMAFTAG